MMSHGKMISTIRRLDSVPTGKTRVRVTSSLSSSLIGALLLMVATVHLLASPIGAQDLLRNQRQQPQQQQQQQQQQLQLQQQQQNLLANIQLPPQLASLTPQQLHQLAQIRELQLQQEARQREQQQQQAAAAPAPIGLEMGGGVGGGAQPTAQPAAAPSPGQIPQPTTTTSATTSPQSDNNERHDDGAYNEASSEMEGVASSGGDPAAAAPNSASTTTPATGTGAGAAGAQAAPIFEVNWNKCPQLEPSESEKNKKTQVITKCLQAAPIPANLTRENVEQHREQIATCALKVEGWFDDTGNYRYDKAESEIRGKKLEPQIEIQVLKFHVACKEEANRKFPRTDNKLIDQVQFYQACMDYYISIVCEIEVSVDQ